MLRDVKLDGKNTKIAKVAIASGPAMDCPKCARAMKPLFISYVCDHCDGLALDEELDTGWTVWRNRPLPADEYVFATREDAERWRAIQGLENCGIVEVRAPVRFKWRLSNGTIKGLRMADRLVTIYPNRFFPKAPNRAFLA